MNFKNDFWVIHRRANGFSFVQGTSKTQQNAERMIQREQKHYVIHSPGGTSEVHQRTSATALATAKASTSTAREQMIRHASAGSSHTVLGSPAHQQAAHAQATMRGPKGGTFTVEHGRKVYVKR